MSDIILELFNLAMEELPYIPNPDLAKAEKALRARLGQEGKSLLEAYTDAFCDRSWEENKYIFYTALSLGIELGTLGTLTPSAGACRRR